MEELRVQVQLPSNAWFDISPAAPLDKVVLVKMQDDHSSDQPAVISNCLVVEPNLQWKLSVYGQLVLPDKCTPLSRLPTKLELITDLKKLLSTIDQLCLCAGNPDQHFVEMVEAKKGKLLSPSGTVAAFVDRNAPILLNGKIVHATVRSSECQILTSASKCPQCVRYRDTVRAMHHRWQKRKPSLQPTSSHINDRWLTTPEKKLKTCMLRQRVRSAEAAVKYLKEKIKISTSKLGVDIDDPLHSGLESIMLDETTSIQGKYMNI